MVMKIQKIRVRLVGNCPLCRGNGEVLYQGVKDASSAAPGEWNFRRCIKLNCGMVWLDPAPITEDLGLTYQGYYTHEQPEPGTNWVRDFVWAIWMGYLIQRFGYPAGTVPAWQRALAPLALLHPGGRAELDAAAMHLPAPTGVRQVLDVGCGSGILLARMQRLGWQVQGVDFDEGAVKAARAHGIHCAQGELAPQNYPSDFFDVVHLSHVVEHVPDPFPLLGECRRILKPGGSFICRTPNVSSWGHKHLGKAWQCLDIPRHLNLFTMPALRQAAVTAGFKIVRLETTVRTAWVFGALGYCIRRTGRAEWSELHKPLNLLKGIVYQQRQRLALLSDKQAGDELLLIATKS
jgi:SAM-dependent methyltransferase